MWHKIALEMKLPWRSVEAWHWTIGRKELAKRVAGLHQHESPTDLDLGAAEEDSSLVFPDDDPDEDPELEPDIDYEFETKPGEASTCSAGATRVTGK